MFTQASPDSEGKPQRDDNSTTYVGTLQCSENFGALLRREAFARGYASAQKTVYLGDGAAWVWEVARIHFPQAICILDFYHAGEHLSLLAEALYCADPPRIRLQATIWRAMLLENHLEELLAQAREDLPDIPELWRRAPFARIGMLISWPCGQESCKNADDFSDAGIAESGASAEAQRGVVLPGHFMRF